MVQILRFMSPVVVVAACAIAIFVLVFGFGPNLEIQKKLSQASIVEKLKKDFGDFTKKDEKEPPLVIQAREFALRIDPPLPLKIITPPQPEPDTQPTLHEKSNGRDNEPINVQAGLTLIGTASYIGHPEKSLALLSLVSGDYKWVCQGEIIDQSTVAEIKDGRIVIYENGTMHKDLFVPKLQSSLKPLYRN